MTTPNQWPITGTLRAGWVFSYEPQTMDHLAHQGFCCAHNHNNNPTIHHRVCNRTTDTMNTFTSNRVPQSACHGYRAGDSLHYIPKGIKADAFRRKANEVIARSQARIDARKTVKFTPNPNYTPPAPNTFASSSRADRAFISR